VKHGTSDKLADKDIHRVEVQHCYNHFHNVLVSRKKNVMGSQLVLGSDACPLAKKKEYFRQKK